MIEIFQQITNLIPIILKKKLYHQNIPPSYLNKWNFLLYHIFDDCILVFLVIVFW